MKISIKLIFSVFVLFISLKGISQNKSEKEPASTADINVVVTNTKQVPQKGEVVLFISEKNKKKFSCSTNSKGEASLKLPAGDIYSIKLKTLNDETSYSTLEIPALQPGQFFEGPMTISIEFEPPRSYTLNNVHFDTGKPTLRANSFKELDEIAGYMKIRDTENFEISGHTDNVGNDADNMKLSQQRAESVKAYLIKKGISAGRLKAKGYGSSQPVADNNTAEGRQKNRRTEILVL